MTTKPEREKREFPMLGFEGEYIRYGDPYDDYKMCDGTYEQHVWCRYMCRAGKYWAMVEPSSAGDGTWFLQFHNSHDPDPNTDDYADHPYNNEIEGHSDWYHDTLIEISALIYHYGGKHNG